MNITSITKNISSSVEKVYQYINEIHFDGIYFRKDIAAQALSFFNETKSITYKESGVDIHNADLLIEIIKPLCKKTARLGFFKKILYFFHYL